MKPRTVDYVIVGAGSAGCTLAARLTEDAACPRSGAEAGGWDRDPWIHLPLGWGRLLKQRRHDWMYESRAGRRTGERRIECARGKMVGGSSSINAMAYVRGHRADYDRWAATACPDMVICGRAAVFPPPGILGGRREANIAAATVRWRRARRATRIR